MRSFWFSILVIVGVFACFPLVQAFGAGEIPDYAIIKGKSFRHGDIENILKRLVKNNTKGSGGILQSIMGGGSSGKTFTTADVKHVYFGNWLRDYSQAMDLAGLQKMTKETIIMVLSVLSFLCFGYATEEYELTAPRIGVYLPVEHIDNPKGYADKEGDPRKFHPWLRPPVNEKELQIDPRTGMKNYIANEGNFWDTSTACVRRNLGRAIELARLCQLDEGGTLYEAYRLLGTGLHTLEDLLAHSNWVELTLIKMGHSQVFPYVGGNVLIDSPRGRVPPLVTGTFGSADFMFSVMSEGSDKISQNSVEDLNQTLNNAQGSGTSSIDSIKSLLGKLPSFGDGQNKIQQGEQMKQDAIHFDPNKYTSAQTQAQIWEALCWRDSIMREIDAIISGIPGLEALVDEISQALTVFVYSIIQPYIMVNNAETSPLNVTNNSQPYLKEVSTVLSEQSKAVVEEDKTQFEVFEESSASDPTHSMISKDHFDNILNEPAGRVAQVVVEHAVNLVVGAWSDPSRDIGRTLNEIMQAFHHPHFMDPRSPVQCLMEQALGTWFQQMRRDEQDETLRRLTKDSVRRGQNKRLDMPFDTPLQHNHSQPAYAFGQQPQQHAPMYQGGPGPAQYQQGPGYQSGPPPGQYQQAPYPAQYGPPQQAHGGGQGPYASPPGPPTGFGSPLPPPPPPPQDYGGRQGPYASPPGPPAGFGSPPPPQEHGRYGGPPMNQGPNYGPVYGAPQGYGGQPPYQQYGQPQYQQYPQPPPQQYAQPPYQQYGPPPQQSGGGGYGQWAGAAAGGLAGLAGGVFLAEEGGNMVDGIENSVDDVTDFYDM